MDTAIFLHWAHRELWNIVAEICKEREESGRLFVDNDSIKEIAYKELLRKYPNLPNHVPNVCFACLSVQRLRLKDCYCNKLCPIDWGKTSTGKYKHCCDIETTYTYFMEAIVVTEDLEEAYFLANRIANMPLKSEVTTIYRIVD